MSDGPKVPDHENRSLEHVEERHAERHREVIVDERRHAPDNLAHRPSFDGALVLPTSKRPVQDRRQENCRYVEENLDSNERAVT